MLALQLRQKFIRFELGSQNFNLPLDCGEVAGRELIQGHQALQQLVAFGDFVVSLGTRSAARRRDFSRRNPPVNRAALNG